MKDESLDWLETAYIDLVSAHALYKFCNENNTFAYNNVAYHLEQFVEKVVKSFCIENDVSYKYGHSVHGLIYKLNKIDSECFTKELLIEADKFDTYTNQTKMRYPDGGCKPSEYYTKEKIDQCLTSAKNIVEPFFALLDLDPKIISDIDKLFESIDKEPNMSM